MAEADDFWVFDVAPDLAVLIPEPFGKSLNCKSRRPKADSYRFGREAFVQK